MSKTRKFLTTLTMVAVATTTSMSVVSSAQAHSALWLAPHPHPHFVGDLPPGVIRELYPRTPAATPTPPPRRSGLRRGEAAALGLLGGVIIGGALANANRGQVRPVGLPAEHYAWCDARYRSYVIATNTFTGYDGRQHICFSPYVR